MNFIRIQGNTPVDSEIRNKLSDFAMGFPEEFEISYDADKGIVFITLRLRAQQAVSGELAMNTQVGSDAPNVIAREAICCFYRELEKVSAKIGYYEVDKAMVTHDFYKKYMCKELG
jgi:hypothetical protein